MASAAWNLQLQILTYVRGGGHVPANQHTYSHKGKYRALSPANLIPLKNVRLPLSEAVAYKNALNINFLFDNLFHADVLVIAAHKIQGKGQDLPHMGAFLKLHIEGQIIDLLFKPVDMFRP